MEMNFPWVIDFKPNYDVEAELIKRAERRMDVAQMKADDAAIDADYLFSLHSDAAVRVILRILNGEIPFGTAVRSELRHYIEWAEESGVTVGDFDELNVPDVKSAITHIVAMRRNIVAWEYTGILLGLFYYLSENAYYQQLCDIQRTTGLAADLFGGTGVDEDLDPGDAVRHMDSISESTSSLFFDSVAGLARRVHDLDLVEHLKKLVEEELDTVRYALRRQVRTETTDIVSGYQAKAMERSFVRLYKFLTERDSKVCPICQVLDRKVFQLKNRQTGFNYPPMHPNCRCTTIPHLQKQDIDSLKQQASALPYTYMTVPESMTYEQWLKEWEIRLDETMPE